MAVSESKGFHGYIYQSLLYIEIVSVSFYIGYRGLFYLFLLLSNLVVTLHTTPSLHTTPLVVFGITHPYFQFTSSHSSLGNFAWVTLPNLLHLLRVVLMFRLLCI